MREEQAGIVAQVLSIFNAIPEDVIAVTVYGLGSLLILSCWFAVVKRLPHPLNAILWIAMFAILLTPTVSAGENASLAPAIFGLLFGVLTKDSSLIWSNVTLIFLVMGLGCLVAWCWSNYRSTKYSSSATK